MHEVNVDYLAFSHPAKEASFQTDDYKEISGFGFYTHGYEGHLGNRTFFGNPNSRKAYTIMSGTALHNCRVVGWSDRDTVDKALSMGGKISRIDWCITDYIEDSLVTVDDVSEACSKGQVEGTLTKYGWKQISGADVGEPLGIETCYIGAPKRRGKNGIFRAYDKGLELNLDRYLITRLELEERADNAHNSAKRYTEGAEIKQIMNSRLKFKSEAIMNVFEAQAVDISRGQGLIIKDEDEENDARWQWLMKQVVPALRKAVSYDRNNGKGDDRIMKFLYSAGIVRDTD